jgi:acetolactate synthase I/II/III large subunit
MKKTGASILLDYLRIAGIERVAGIPGGSNLPLYDELSRHPIRHILARHEQGAGFIAEGEARRSGKPGVVFVTSGPGATNLITVLANAYLDSVPLLAVSGQVSRTLRGSDAFQEVDTGAIAKPVVKAEFYAGSAKELLAIVPRALLLTLSGRPGPVLIDIPKDVFIEETEFDSYQPVDLRPARIHPSDKARSAAVRMLYESRRPVIIAGGGMRHLQDHPGFLKFIEESGIPVVTTLMGTGSVPTLHQNNFGMAGMHGSPVSTAVLDRADLLIALGSRFGDRTTGRKQDFAADARIIHIDLDESEHGKILPADLAIHADIESFLKRTFYNLKEYRISSEWRDETDQIKNSIDLNPPGIYEPGRPTAILREISHKLPAGTRVVTDVGQHQMWAARSMFFDFPGEFLKSAGLGTMGFGLPAGIGASLSGEMVVVVSGDGSLFMNIQEMDTAVQERSNLKLILLDNRRLGMVAQQQTLFLGGRHVASTFTTNPDFTGIARSMEWSAVNFDAEMPEDSIEKFLSIIGPVMLYVPVHPEEMVSPTVPPGSANRDAIHSNYVRKWTDSTE